MTPARSGPSWPTCLVRNHRHITEHRSGRALPRMLSSVLVYATSRRVAVVDGVTILQLVDTDSTVVERSGV